MKLLLDTHAFLWFIIGNPSLSRNARESIEDQAHEKFLSAASVWEIAIKTSIGKLSLSAPLDVLIPEQLSLNGFRPLNINTAHAAAVASLPLRHRDPFDRLLIAQAIAEHMEIVSSDSAFDAYGITRLW
jgi:PIN domain nuclease of toxin-antitoxin system